MTGIAVGVVMGALLFMHRMAETVEIEGGGEHINDVADVPDPRNPYDAAAASDRKVMVYRITGAFFFAATARVLTVLERVGAPKVLVLDFSNVPLIDGTAARALGAFVRKLQRGGTEIYFSAARPNVRQALSDVGFERHTLFSSRRPPT